MSNKYRMVRSKCDQDPYGAQERQSHHLYKQWVNPLCGEFLGSDSPRRGKKQGEIAGWSCCVQIGMAAMD